jgi:3-deoxy-manno-octulosonate cytidylyltransferase (CMP-KDO synthetase)
LANWKYGTRYLCQSDRILDMPFRQRIAPYRSIKPFSVDNPVEIGLVEKHMINDEFWQLYK